MTHPHFFLFSYQSSSADMVELLQNSGLKLSQTTRDIAESLLVFSSPKPLTSHRRKRRSIEVSTPSSYECTPPKQECLDRTQNSDIENSRIASMISTPATPKRPLSARENLATNSNSTNQEIAKDKHSSHYVSKTPQEIKANLSSSDIEPVCCSENEITYLPFNPAKTNTNAGLQHVSENRSPAKSRRPLRPCNAPGVGHCGWLAVVGMLWKLSIVGHFYYYLYFDIEHNFKDYLLI